MGANLLAYGKKVVGLQGEVREIKKQSFTMTTTADSSSPLGNYGYKMFSALGIPENSTVVGLFGALSSGYPALMGLLTSGSTTYITCSTKTASTVNCIISYIEP